MHVIIGVGTFEKWGGVQAELLNVDFLQDSYTQLFYLFNSLHNLPKTKKGKTKAKGEFEIANSIM